MTKRAIWIIDEAFLVVALVSVRSFLTRIKMPVSVMYCGEAGLEKARKAFAEIPGEVEFLPWKPMGKLAQYANAPTERNRLARMEAIAEQKEDLLLLLDADLLFAPGFEALIPRIESQLTQEPGVWGVPEQKIAWHNKFFFHRVDHGGRWQHLHPLEEQEIYQKIYGPDWLHLLGAYNFNNGMLVLHGCQELASQWREYYLKGLEYPQVNPGDDQRPFAAALQALEIKTYPLPEKYNSLGEVMGEYLAFHSYSSRWKMPILALNQGEVPLTGFSKIVSEHWETLPLDLREEFCRRIEERKPHLFESVSGSMEFWWIYQDAIKLLPGGHFVEVEPLSAKGTCFMAESLAIEGKEGRFDVVTCSWDDHEILDAIHPINFIDLPSSVAAETYQDESLDFIYLAGGTSSASLLADLEAWWFKLRPGGILAGIDRSVGTSLSLVATGIAGSFCERQGHSCRYQGVVFVMEKEADKGLYNSSQYAENRLKGEQVASERRAT